MSDRIPVGISACLLGREVRWDGGHNYEPYLVEVLGAHVDWVPVCPEDEAGMGTPREPVDLVRLEGRVRMVARSGRDWTPELEALARRRLRGLGTLRGFVFKAGSPSCGLATVKLLRPRGRPVAGGTTGLFAAAFREAHPLIPCAEEGELRGVAARDSFVERVFAYDRIRALLERGSAASLDQFHLAHELQLETHSPTGLAALRRLLRRSRGPEGQGALEEYARTFMEALEHPATAERHAAALRQALALLSPGLVAGERQAVRAAIADFTQGRAPLLVPLTLLRHLAGRAGIGYVAGQTYLHVHPSEMLLRYHA